MASRKSETARRAATIVLVFTGVGLLTGWILWNGWGTPRFFFAFLWLFAVELYLIAGFLVWLSLSSIWWKLLPRATKFSYQGRRGTFKSIVLACLILFIAAGWYINYRWLPGRFHPISLTADAAFAIVIATFGFLLLSPRARNVAVFFVAAMVFTVLVFSVRSVRVDIGQPGTGAKGLGALVYVSWTQRVDIKTSGVTYHDSTKASPGLNLYNSDNEAVARLIDNSGEPVHEWTSTQAEGDNFDHIELCSNGDLIAIKSRSDGPISILRLDWESNVLWEVVGDYHHDIAVAPSGDIYTILSISEVVSFRGMPLPIINEYIVVFSPGGRIKRQTPLYEFLASRIVRRRIRESYTYLIAPPGWKILFNLVFARTYYLHYDRFDPFHVNTVEILANTFTGGSTAGDILICVRNMNLVVVLDSELRQSRYEWGPGELRWPHHPSLLENGNILVFDNGPFRNFSRVVEFDPSSKTVVWEYKADTPQDFFSSVQGACQRLANGNTLITESANGRAFEVTNDGRIVWEFFNPDVDEATARRGTIYRLIRIDKPDDITGLVTRAASVSQSP